ncbi:isochorismatase family protein [Cryptosporangium sp. NPDC048952]|uniref:isochorismatase family protein n=1 Tax=Cryptosporangium sp. NPDC048952 TaxID=3363961 RepID=UPI0037177EE5
MRRRSCAPGVHRGRRRGSRPRFRGFRHRAGARRRRRRPVPAGRRAAALRPPASDREIALFKLRWGAFYRTELDSWLREQDIDTLVVAGCPFPTAPGRHCSRRASGTIARC